MGHHADERLSK